MELDTKTQEQINQEWKDACMDMCRTKRDQLLAETDFIHLPDVSIDADYKASLVTYRQQLRDFPASFSTIFDNYNETEKDGVTPHSIPFPTKPSAG